MKLYYENNSRLSYISCHENYRLCKSRGKIGYYHLGVIAEAGIEAGENMALVPVQLLRCTVKALCKHYGLKYLKGAI